jgi:hypothetical protein
LCFVLSLISPIFAAEQNVWLIDSFEPPTGPSIWWSLPPGTTSSTLGVTDGSYSIKVPLTGSSWWNEAMLVDIGGLDGGNDAFFSHQYFSIDLTMFQSDWVMDTAIGWTSPPVVGLILNPGSGQWWEMPAIPLSFDQTQTLTWDYSAYRDQVSNPQGVIKFIFKFVNYGYVSPVYDYFDYSRLHGVPEPATIALLGLGALALLRRKR